MKGGTPTRSRPTAGQGEDANERTPTQALYNTAGKKRSRAISHTGRSDDGIAPPEGSPTLTRRHAHSITFQPDGLEINLDLHRVRQLDALRDPDVGKQIHGKHDYVVEETNVDDGSSGVVPPSGGPSLSKKRRQETIENERGEGGSSDGKGLRSATPAPSTEITTTTITVFQIKMDELLIGGCSFTEFLRTEVPPCPSAYDPDACSTTRKPTGADFSLADDERRLELLGLFPHFMDEAAAEVLERLKSIPLDGSNSWVAAQFGCYHPLFTGRRRSPRYNSEMDIADLVLNVLLRPALFALEIWHTLHESKQLPASEYQVNIDTVKAAAKDMAKRLFEIVEEESHQITFSVGSSPPLAIPNGRTKGSRASEKKYKAVPDFTGTKSENVQATVKTSLLKRRQGKGAAPGESKFASFELKTPNAYKVMIYLERLIQARAKGVSGEKKHIWLEFKWPEGDGDEVVEPEDKILCQIITQMAAIEANHAALTCYKRTLFFFRDPERPSVIYCSRSYGKRDPLLLFYTTFLEMAAAPDLLGDYIPKPGDVDSMLTNARNPPNWRDGCGLRGLGADIGLRVDRGERESDLDE